MKTLYNLFILILFKKLSQNSLSITKSLIMLIFLLVSLLLNSQNYYLSFTSNNPNYNLDYVFVENITQCTSVELQGNDVLFLDGTNSLKDNTNNLNFYTYPNPFNDILYLVSYNKIDNILINIYSISGKLILKKEFKSKYSNEIFKIEGLSKGIYIVEIITPDTKLTKKVISVNEDYSRNLVITEVHICSDIEFVENIRSAQETKSLVTMEYNEGDILKLMGISGIHKTVKILQVTQNQIVDFDFFPCIDSDGQSYAIVKIGNQWWMAENLNTGTYAPISYYQQPGTKFCMDINGNEDPSCPLGGLYEWSNLMQGATPCNGFGAPPNDACSQPIKGLCPNGWHIPSHYEWTTLANAVGGTFQYNSNLGISPFGGGELKMNCTNYWWSPNAGATNSSGFSALPGGDSWHGIFEDFGQSAYFWTSTAIFTYTYHPWVYALNYSVPSIGRSQYFNEHGFSCRCIKD